MNAVIWSKDNCAFCEQAKSLMRSRGIDFVEKKIGYQGITKEDLLKEVPDAKSVPQIFLDGKYVGGFNELRKIV